jgi:5-aminopentanamidase
VTNRGVTRVACCQLDPVILDVAGNMERGAQAIAAAVARGADIVVLPELASSGYMFDSAAELAAVALTPDDDRLSGWREPLRGGAALVVAGFPERGADGLFYNASVLLDADGVLAIYRKTHLWNREKLFFTQGGRPPPVVHTRHGRLGLLICYDLDFPEVPRALALRGADLLVAPTNWGLLGRPPGEQPPQVLNIRAAARASHVFIAACDRTGTERGQHWTGGTAIVDAEGWVAATPGTDGIAIADLPLAAARDRKLSDLNDVFGDRRPELYGALRAGAEGGRCAQGR